MRHKILNYISVIAQHNVDTFYGPPCESATNSNMHLLQFIENIVEKYMDYKEPHA